MDTPTSSCDAKGSSCTTTMRLARLLKGTRYYKDPIRCELFEAPLPEDNDERDDSYEALSYTWGDASHTVAILVNDQLTQITANLYHALRHLRLSDADRILWVDALCIDQQNETERSHRVAQMRLFYKKASNVIIWLGLSTEEIDLFMEAARTLDKRVMARPKPARGSDPLGIWHSEGIAFVADMKAHNVEFHDMRQRALADLLQRPWFYRTWTVPEASSASQATIQCSWNTIPARAFTMMAAALNESSQTISQSLLEVIPGPLRAQSWWYQDRSLCTLMQKFSWCKTTDPRDQIYALLVVSSDYTVPGCSLQPDYRLNLAEVIRNTISHLAFGQILDAETYKLPPMSLDELTNSLSHLTSFLLEWAICENVEALVRKLIHTEKSVDVNGKLPCKDPPLHLVIAMESSNNVIDILLQRSDLDVNQLGASFEPADMESNGNNNHFTPLSLAVYHGQARIARLLLKRSDVDATKVDAGGKTPLIRAVEQEHLGLIDILLPLDPGETPHHTTNLSWDHCTILLVYASKLGKTASMQYFLRKGASPNSVDHLSMDTALTAAARAKHVKAVEILLAAGADPNLLNLANRSALLITVEGNSVGLARILLASGARTDVPEATSPLWLAAGGDNCDMVGLLVGQGANMEARVNGRTPIWNAAYHNHLPVVRLLADFGADLSSCGEKVPRYYYHWDSDSLEMRSAVCEFLHEHGVHKPFGYPHSTPI